jgi:hypothetical protein
MKGMGISAAIVACACLIGSAIVVKPAEARVFKGGSSQRVGVVNPADPGPVTVPVPNTHGGGPARSSTNAPSTSGKSK